MSDLKDRLPNTPPLAPSPIPDIARLSLADLSASLRLGWRDFCAAPEFGIFFSAVYVVIGFALVALGAGTVFWTFALSLAFPLFAPFAAVGLYDVSRRLSAKQPLVWGAVLQSVLDQKSRQLPWIGAILVIYVLFWSFIAHMIFALFMGLSTLTNVSSSYEVFLTPNGLTMIAVELAIGAVLAFFLFALTVVSLPLLLEKELDFVTAMIVSVDTVRQNFWVMLIWAALIAFGTVLAMLPYFFGLFVTLPVFGHASWHLYARALVPDGETGQHP